MSEAWLETLMESTDVPSHSPDVAWVASVSPRGLLLVNAKVLYEGHAAAAKEWVWKSPADIVTAIRGRRVRNKTGLIRYIERVMHLSPDERFRLLTTP